MVSSPWSHEMSGSKCGPAKRGCNFTLGTYTFKGWELSLIKCLIKGYCLLICPWCEELGFVVCSIVGVYTQYVLFLGLFHKISEITLLHKKIKCV